GPAVVLAVLQLAVADLVHHLLQQALLVPLEERVPEPAPNHLDDVPAGAAEHALQFLDDLAVAPHRAVEALQVAVDHEHQILEALAAGEGDGAEAFRLVALTVAEEGPHLAVYPGHQSAGR